MRYVYYFMHKTKVKRFGPYETMDEAMEAFQKVYGYWPENAISVEQYV